MKALTELWVRDAFLLACCLGGLGGVCSAQEYGYLVAESDFATIWWAEGAYKVMKDDPVPATRSDQIVLRAAANEYEPFLLVIRPRASLT